MQTRKSKTKQNMYKLCCNPEKEREAVEGLPAGATPSTWRSYHPDSCWMYSAPFPSLHMAADRWYKIQYVLSPVNVLQASTSSHGIYGSTDSLLRSKTEKINIIFISIISEGWCCHSVTVMLTLCDPTDCSTPGFPVFLCLPEFA